MANFKQIFGLPAALLAITAAAPAPAVAAVPTQAAMEGVLLSSGGGPAADGNYTVALGIYAAETGGTAVWTETGVTIAAKGGQFSYLLGSKTPLAAAALSLPKAWIGLQIGTDPELPRKPLGSSPYALRAAIAEGLECTGCLKAGHLDAAVLQPYAKAADLAAYAKSADLAAYAKVSDLGIFAKTADLSNYAKTADLADYVKASSLAKVAGTGSYADLTNKPTLAAVATSGSYADLSNKPVMAKLGASCGTNLVVKGIKADGTYECVSAGIGPDMINEVSNDLIWNQFVDSKAGATDVQIKDGFSAGVTDTLSFPDVGLAEKIWVNFSGLNSDMSKVIVELYGPGMGSPYILYNGGKTGTALVAKYNDGDALVSGDMNKDWLNKNIKGNWSITVKDIAAISVPPGTPPFVYDGKFNWGVSIQTLSSKKIQVKGNLIVDGDATIGGTLSAKTINAPAYGSVFTHWGNKTCPTGSDKLYEGAGFSGHYSHTHGAPGICTKGGDPGASNGYEGDILYAMNVSGTASGIPGDKSLYCAVCRWPKGFCFEQWGSSTCPSGFSAAYAGTSMGAHYTHSGPTGHYCIDPTGFDTSTASTGNGWLYVTRIQSQGNFGSAWPGSREVKCAVCCAN